MNDESTLLRLCVALDSGRPVPPDLAQWLACGIRMLREGRASSWDEALGWTKASSAERIERRNYWLRQASDLMKPVNATQVAQRLESGRRLPANVRELRARAAKAAKIPGKRQILRIVQNG